MFLRYQACSVLANIRIRVLTTDQLFFQIRFYRFKNVVDDDRITLAGRVDSVGLVEFSITGYPFEEKWDESCVVLFRKLGEHRLEFPDVVRP